MRKNNFKVVTDNSEDYQDKLDEFTEMMVIWASKREGRDYEINEDRENLKFNIIAKEHEEEGS